MYHTVIASESCFANGVVHCLASLSGSLDTSTEGSEDDHLFAAQVLHCCLPRVLAQTLPVLRAIYLILSIVFHYSVGRKVTSSYIKVKFAIGTTKNNLASQ